jgi:hypothetical protein
MQEILFLQIKFRTMKNTPIIKIALLLVLLNLLLTEGAFAQSPQGFNYQAIVRNSSGQLLLNQIVLVKFKILQNSATGTIVYSETQTANTDDLGQVSLVVGIGTASTGTFSNINWGSGSYYLGIELNTGSGYVAMGTTQLLSVPYALYANSAGSTGGFIHYLGELYGGGIVVSVWKTSGVEHGLIASLTDLGTSIWSNVDSVLVGTSKTDGQANTIAIINQLGHSTSAAKLCKDYKAGGFSDWYLPSSFELNQCYSAAIIVNSVLGDLNSFQSIYYWSSTENNESYPLCQYTDYGHQKGSIVGVRAIRKF